MESYIGKFVRYENAYITLIPLDAEKPREGGKVKVHAFEMDWRTFIPAYKTMFGVYGEDFISFGEFESKNILENEENLIKVCQDSNSDLVPLKTSFRF
jgi:hypothetical protein